VPKALAQGRTVNVNEFTELLRAPLYIGSVFKPTEPRSQMNFNRRSYRDDLLFVIALLVPAVFAGARYVESERQIVQIEQAQSQGQGALVAVDGDAQAHLRVAYAERHGR
jgi:hypothetical protein